MISFAWPWMIVLLALPVLVRVLTTVRNTKRAPSAPEIAFPHIRRLEAAFPAYRKTKVAGWLHAALGAGLWLCLTLALMQPQLLNQFTLVNNQGHDLILAVDLSGSMQAADYDIGGRAVSRLDVVKTVVGEFIAQREGDRVGLLLFGSNAYLHVPLTADIASVQKMLANTQVGMAGNETAIGDAIGMAVTNLRNRPENSRVVILMTDGADNSSSVPPLQAAGLAKQYGIRIYTIGVGSEKPVSALNQNGERINLIGERDEGLLQRIAEETGAVYSAATDTNGLRFAYARINDLEKTSAEGRTFVVPSPLYRYPLGAALLLLLALACLPVFHRAAHES